MEKRKETLMPLVLVTGPSGAGRSSSINVLEDLGFECFAVEPDSINLHFLYKLRKAEKKAFHVVEKRLFEYQEKTKFDIVLALYVFHHFLKTKQQFEQLKLYLDKLECNQIFLATHVENEAQMKGAYANFSADEFVDFILDYSGLSKKKYLSTDMYGRKLFVLSK